MVTSRILLIALLLSGCGAILGTADDAEMSARRACQLSPLPADEVATYGQKRARERDELRYGRSPCVDQYMNRWYAQRREDAADMRMIARQNGFAVPYRVSGSGRIY